MPARSQRHLQEIQGYDSSGYDPDGNGGEPEPEPEVPEVTFVEVKTDPATAQNYNLTIDIGDDDADGTILALGVVSRSGGQNTIISVTLGGVTMEQVVQLNANPGAPAQNCAAIFIIPRASVATGSLWVNHSGNMVRLGVALWRLKRVDPVKYDTLTLFGNNDAAAQNVSGVIDEIDKGITVAIMMYMGAASAANFSAGHHIATASIPVPIGTAIPTGGELENLVEDHDGLLEAGGGMSTTFAAAHFQPE